MLPQFFTVSILTFTSLLLNSCFYVDTNHAKNTRQWISICAATQGDLYCKAAKKIVKEIDGPIVFLIPNQGIQDSTRSLVNNYGVEAIEHFVRANTFKAYDLQTGRFTSLDRQTRQVTCRVPGKGCRIENLLLGRQNYTFSTKEYNGMVYSSSDKNKGDNNFLFPKNQRDILNQ